MDNNKEALIVTVSPHIRGGITTNRIMLDVLIALFPAFVASVVLFGARSILVTCVCVASCILCEWVFEKAMKKPNTLGDLTACITGVLLAFSLPVSIPVWQAVFGSFVAIILVKQLFGGLGKNFANPAVTARVFLTLAFAQIMGKFVLPITYGGVSDFFNFNSITGEISTGATPLLGGNNLLNLFLGNVGGAIGETSKLALLIGGGYLLISKIIGWEIPVVLIFSFAAFILIFKGDISAVLPEVLSGGLIFAAIFMATDYSTSPNTKIGVCIYAFVIGFFNAFLRRYSAMAEGISFAVLLGNLCVPLIDRYIIPKPFGSKKTKNKKGN
ncbi:MAG: RnfABCDGE type electron transport complex subunit D [Firmicutes bacterium]|nr:RnfABCDGE type electron transport complex subunit D [Bacillota bacterium]